MFGSNTPMWVLRLSTLLAVPAAPFLIAGIFLISFPLQNLFLIKGSVL
jgi:hypothetical protein